MASPSVVVVPPPAELLRLFSSPPPPHATDVVAPPPDMLRVLSGTKRRRPPTQSINSSPKRIKAAASADRPAQSPPPAQQKAVTPSGLPDVFSVLPSSSPTSPAPTGTAFSASAPWHSPKTTPRKLVDSVADVVATRRRAKNAAGTGAAMDALQQLLEKSMWSGHWGLRDEVVNLLALTMVQEGQRDAAATLLADEGYHYRLSDAVLRYPLPATLAARPAREIQAASDAALARAKGYVTAYDDALPPALFSAVQHAFRRDGLFWTEHGYTVGKTPYFSYRQDLPRCDGDVRNVMDAVVRAVWHLMQRDIPNAADAKYAEWWAHCRPHHDAHQLHFDSDNEGKGGVRNPIANCIIFITEGCGGPTMVTTHHHGATSLSNTGFLVYPKENRIVAYPANVLHGVIPGRGVAPVGADGADLRRTTLMVALWGDSGCKLRPSAKQGAARPFPAPNGADGKHYTNPDPRGYTWPDELELSADVRAAAKGGGAPQAVGPVMVDGVWEDVSVEENRKKRRLLKDVEEMPHYDLCFQGF